MHHSTILFFSVLVQAKRPFSSLRSWILPTLQMGVRRGRKGVFRLHHSTTFLFSVLMQAKRPFSSLKSLILPPAVFSFFLDPLVFI